MLGELLEEGKVRAVGVSNFDVKQLRQVMKAGVKPHVVQNWMDPFHPDVKVREFCRENDIVYTSYSTLGGVSSL